MSEIKTVNVQFSAPGDRAVAIAGELVHVIDASGPLFVQLDNLGAWVELEKALGLRVRDGFRGIRVRSDMAQSVQLMIGSGDVIDARTVLTGGTAMQIAGGDTIGSGAVAVGDVAAEVVPENIARVAVLIQCDRGPVFIGHDNAVTVNNSVRLESGESIKITAKAAVWAVAGSPGQEVRYLEEIN